MYNPALKNGVHANIDILAPQKVRILLDKAMGLMKQTKDPSHGMEHIHNLLQETNRFFKSTGDKFDIDRDVLVLALYWHDVWKSQVQPSWRNYLFLQLYEGLGSMRMFKSEAEAVGLSPGMIQSVSYAIRKHSAFQAVRAKTLEAQLLWDMDTLDIWNLQRTRAGLQNMGRIHIAAFDAYVRYVKKAGSRLYFEWTKNEVRKVAPLFLEEMAKIRKSLINARRGVVK